MPDHAMPDNLDKNLVSGVLNKHPNTRFWMFIVFAILSLALSAAMQALVFDLVPAENVQRVSNLVAWASSVLNMVGTFLGFTAASNVPGVHFPGSKA